MTSQTKPESSNPRSGVLEDAKRAADKAQNDLDQLRQKIADMEGGEPDASQAEEAVEVAQRGAGRYQAENAVGSSADAGRGTEEPAETGDAVEELRREPMMAHLFDALADGKDIGHYGRLVFAMVAHHFLSDDEMLAWLTKDPDFDESAARTLLRQVEGRDYNPPRRQRILEWQSQQDFPILPNADDPDAGNVYRNLRFPQKVYEHIEEYQEEKTAAGE